MQGMEYRHVLLDFDGVLAESNEIRFQGFAELFRDIPRPALDRFMTFVRAHGGVSRYAKIRYLYDKILERPVPEEEVNALARQYSHLVMERIIAAEAVPGSLDFLKRFSGRYDLAVVSGSDQQELRQVCRARHIDHYFRAILGSPREKAENIGNLLASECWEARNCLYVGDSHNDHEVAVAAGIGFIGRDSGLVDWRGSEVVWIASLAELPAAIENLSQQRQGGAEPSREGSSV